MKKYINVINLFLIISILVGDIFYITYGTLLIKSITSVCFVILGAINLWYIAKLKKGNNKYGIIMLVGLNFAMLGDILLEIEFIVGALLFAIGHIFYFCAYNVIKKFNIKDLVYGLCIFVPSLLIILFVPILNFDEILMKIVCCVYALIISLMVGKSLSNFIYQKSKQNSIILIGSVLFFVSDFMLLLSNFGGIPLTGIFCLLTYYPAEILLAVSIKIK